MSNAEHISFDEQNPVNQLNYRHNQGGLIAFTEDFKSHPSYLEDGDKMPLKNNHFFSKTAGIFS